MFQLVSDFYLTQVVYGSQAISFNSTLYSFLIGDWSEEVQEVRPNIRRIVNIVLNLLGNKA